MLDGIKIPQHKLNQEKNQCTKMKKWFVKNVQQNTSSQQVSKNSTQKKDSLTNQNAARIAEKTAARLTVAKEKCMMPYVQNADVKHRFLSNQFKEKTFTAKTAS